MFWSLDSKQNHDSLLGTPKPPLLCGDIYELKTQADRSLFSNMVSGFSSVSRDRVPVSRKKKPQIEATK